MPKPTNRLLEVKIADVVFPNLRTLKNRSAEVRSRTEGPTVELKLIKSIHKNLGIASDVEP